MFNISFVDEPILRNDELVALGRIEGPSLRENFWAPVEYWGKNQYEMQWRDAIQTALAGRPSAIITAMRDPRYARFINWWPIYPVKDHFRLQNQMLLLESIGSHFNEQDLYVNVPPYTNLNSDGELLSEWEISKPLILDFLNSL
ncbi:hypothetical protein [Acidovorax sp. PRC11]|uniref:hypothetical protein n=1 Tax=Acidovorax sp. PRC11 TaxID=2962592 RepID=UPI002881ED8B|nr:hypothetical protein [Acidovorax sp. PRC11]MDT0140814.1 hypothetical protein [Acidovorax sp. PRC11]